MVVETTWQTKHLLITMRKALLINPELHARIKSHAQENGHALRWLVEKWLSEQLDAPAPATKKAPTKKRAVFTPCEEVQVIWKNYPQSGRTRSSLKKAQEKWSKLAKEERPSVEALAQSLHAWGRCQQWDGGQFVPGVHRWIEGMQWLATPTNKVERVKYL